MKLIVTGATGFTGNHVVSRLSGEDVTLRCIARASSDRVALERYPIEWVIGDLNDPAALMQAFAGEDCLLHVASLGFDYVPGIVKAAEDAGIKRAIFVSSTAIFTSIEAPSRTLRARSEAFVTASHLNYTIIRPTMIYGTLRDRNMSKLIRYLHRLPVLPIFGSGRFLQQPVHVEDVADAIVTAALTPKLRLKAYNIAGYAPITYLDVIDTIAGYLKKAVFKFCLPIRPAIAILKPLEKRGIHLPIKSEQLLRLNENKNFNYSDATCDFAFSPRSFEDGIRTEIQQMGLLKA